MPLTLKALTSAEEGQDVLYEGLRVRLLPRTAIPFVRHLDLYGDAVLLFDQPSTAKSSTTEAGRITDYPTRDAPTEEGFAGNPLAFEFLDLKKLFGTSYSTDGRKSIYATEEFDCNPLPLIQANRIREKLVSAVLEDSLAKLPKIVAVDGCDGYSSALVSVHYEKKERVMTHARHFGRFTKNAEEVISDLNLRFPSSFESSTKATAIYNLRYASTLSRHGPDVVPSSLQFVFTWRKSLTPLSCLESPDASAATVVRCAPGWKDARTVLISETCFLEQLLYMANALREGGEMVWPKSKTDDDLVDRVRELIDSYSKQEEARHMDRYLDFTERLWDVLRDCCSNEMLVAALKIIFDALRAARINTFLHGDNKTMLARLIRDSLSGDLHLPRLEAKTPILILLEIGLERFRRDLTLLFIKQELVASENELSPWLVHPEKEPEELPLLYVPVHLALQTLLEMCRYLKLSPPAVASLTRRVLQKYTATPITDLSQVNFSTEVQYSDVKAEFQNTMKPAVWINETTYSFHKASAAKTTLHFSREDVFAHLGKGLSSSESDDQNDKEVVSGYCVSHFTSSYVSPTFN